MIINKENLDLMHEVLDECESLLKIEYKDSIYELYALPYVKHIIGLVRQGKMIPIERIKNIADDIKQDVEWVNDSQTAYELQGVGRGLDSLIRHLEETKDIYSGQ